MLWFPAPLFGLLIGATDASHVSLLLGVMAVALGAVGLYQGRGDATNRRASRWAVGLGVVFGAMPTVLLILVTAA